MLIYKKLTGAKLGIATVKNKRKQNRICRFYGCCVKQSGKGEGRPSDVWIEWVFYFPNSCVGLSAKLIPHLVNETFFGTFIFAVQPILRMADADVTLRRMR
ncbi:hypothetical protein D1164_02330 [Mariniphaga sediminis]|uniref:Uncharacterized protein n=1 Tax=Mariniphaga sediminis TaxID=1628158 RepID=A0A399D6Q1_9BACT|nr:hypothetical protein D1164_02330 [Mariniphaga sediminis]